MAPSSGALDQEKIWRIVEEVLQLFPDPRFPGDLGPDPAPLDGRRRDLTAPLIEHLAEPEAAAGLIRLLERRLFDPGQGNRIAARLLECHGNDPQMLGRLGRALEGMVDLRFLNDPPCADGSFIEIATKLDHLVRNGEPLASDPVVLDGLATIARLLGRSWDRVAEACLRRLVDLDPDSWGPRYDLGLFLKTRGRFAEGQAANQEAWDRGGHEDDGVLWNLGICATGAGDGDKALELWKRIGQTIERGRHGLPEGRYSGTKVRLAQRPVAERGADQDDPGLEETVWIERLSPCHGVVRSALYQDEIGVDYGDLVLFDGAPVTYHTYGDRTVPVFPHLATLFREEYRIYHFIGEQANTGQLAALSSELAQDTVVYVHTEQLHPICSRCWEDPGTDHGTHVPEERHVVRGKIAAPPSITPASLRASLDNLMLKHPGSKIHAPELSAQAGDSGRAATERRISEALEQSLRRDNEAPPG